jgi:fructose/tagatose bisphosphate aldolase
LTANVGTVAAEQPVAVVEAEVGTVVGVAVGTVVEEEEEEEFASTAGAAVVVVAGN